MTTESSLGSDPAESQLVLDMREREQLRRLQLLKLLQGYVPDLPEQTLGAIASQFAPVEFNEGHRITVQDEPGNAMYLITKGTVQVLFTPFGGAFGASPQELARLGEGDLLGEMALVFNQPRSATAVALEPVEAFSLSWDSWIRLQALYPAFAAKVQEVAENRQRENEQST